MKKAIKITLISILSLVLLGLVVMLSTGISPISMGMHDSVYAEDNMALKGYDVVSYHQGEPKMGRDKIQTEYLGVIWKFSTEANREEFLSDPKKYTPRFGGYCSKAVSTGFTAPANPTVYSVHEDKLYVFSSEDVRVDFMKDPQAIIQACETKWNEE